MKLSLGYMQREEELSVLTREDTIDLLHQIDQVVTKEETMELQKMYPGIEVSEPVKEYLMDIIESTRRDRRILQGASTRAALSLYKASQLSAAIEGRSYVIPEDVRSLAVCIMEHRLSYYGIVRGSEGADICKEIVDSIPVPTEPVYIKGER